MDTPDKVNLTSSEMASLWDAYISHTHSLCILKYFRAKAEDQEILEVMNTIYQVLDKSKTEFESIMHTEGIPIPAGFSDQDVNVSAPRLFSDTFAIMFFKNLSRVMMTSCTLMFTVSTRKDIRELFQNCLNSGGDIFNEICEVMLAKGIYTRAPYIEAPNKVDFIENRDYLNGKDFLKDQRLLNAVEITHVFGNIEANIIGGALLKGFGQTADLKEVRDFMNKASQMSEKVVKSLTEFLAGSQLPSPMGSETQVYSSTQAPFSDKFMMYEATVLVATGISDYAAALAASFRNDLRSHYTDLFTDTSKLGRKAEAIMIENKWLEQPPQQDKISY